MRAILPGALALMAAGGWLFILAESGPMRAHPQLRDLAGKTAWLLIAAAGAVLAWALLAWATGQAPGAR
jgi:hypothetical protein